MRNASVCVCVCSRAHGRHVAARSGKISHPCAEVLIEPGKKSCLMTPVPRTEVGRSELKTSLQEAVVGQEAGYIPSLLVRQWGRLALPDGYGKVWVVCVCFFFGSAYSSTPLRLYRWHQRGEGPTLGAGLSGPFNQASLKESLLSFHVFRSTVALCFSMFLCSARWLPARKGLRECVNSRKRIVSSHTYTHTYVLSIWQRNGVLFQQGFFC